ncbi:MAG: MmgE/PrpD family protein [Chloroflexota bacterium]
MSQTVSQEFARFTVHTKFQDLPGEVVARAKDLILDGLGVQIAGSTLPWCQSVYRYVVDMKVPGQVPVVNHGFRTHPEFASMANATFAHSLEMDDWFPPAPAHPGCVALPVALAYVEDMGGGGKEAVLATVIGYEIILRIALAAGTSFVRDRAVHETSAEGVFGAAAIAARMFRLSEAETVHALGLAASHASGVMEYARTGGEVKRYHAGLAASAGGRCALLARNGLTAPPTAIEGKRGALQALSNSFDVAKLTAGLGSDYLILGTAVKFYATAANLHPPLEGARALVEKHGLKLQDIQEVELGMDSRSMWHVGSAGPRPKDATEAQFSAHFGIALALVKGSNSFATYEEQARKGFKDPEVLAMADKVKLVVDEEVDRTYPDIRQARVTIRTKDGRSFSQMAVNCKGMPQNPLTRAELESKFRGFASLALPASQVDQIVESVARLEKLDGISTLSRLCLAKG